MPKNGCIEKPVASKGGSGIANAPFVNAPKFGQSISTVAPFSENDVGLGCIDMVSATEFWSFPVHSSSSAGDKADSMTPVVGDPLADAGGLDPSGIAFMRRPVDVVNWLIARSRNSALLLDSLNVHLYSSSFSLYASASSLEPALTHRRPMNVPTRAKQYFEEEYQND
jgi:hypothetical protein